MHWGVATTVPSNESRAASDLARVGFETYFPRYESNEVVRGSMLKRNRPLFPGYIFFGLIDLWRNAFLSERVTHVLCSGEDNPAALPQMVIDELRDREAPDGVIRFGKTKKRHRFRVGQSVRMKQGSFAGFLGSIESMSGPDRVKILLEMFGRQTGVIVAETELAA